MCIIPCVRHSGHCIEPVGNGNFVREHACGITIDRLGDLDQAIHTADYEKLKEAALAVAPKLWEGYYLSQAIDSACG